MNEESKKILLIGFNTRPLAYSLNQAGYDVYAVDFFGDLDLYPNVKDSTIILKELNSNYEYAKGLYHQFLAEFTIKLLEKNPNLNYFIIGSGLDDSFEEREKILNWIHSKKFLIIDLNNCIDIIKKARDIHSNYKNLEVRGYGVPLTIKFDKFQKGVSKIDYPFILKKKSSSGGLNIYKIKNQEHLEFVIERLKVNDFNPQDWLIQEYIEGIPVSCTTISNGSETEIISINRQIIGEKYLNSPKEFMYCGNIVPAYLFKEDEKLISEISIFLANELGLKGINGFDFVLKNHYPFLMEINPRIPGSIRASESALNLNLLDLHIKSFDQESWKYIKNTLKNQKYVHFTTKLIFFSPKVLSKEIIEQINRIEHVHDKNDPDVSIVKGAPICTVLFESNTFSESYFGALKIIDKIKQVIG